MLKASALQGQWPHRPWRLLFGALRWEPWVLAVYRDSGVGEGSRRVGGEAERVKRWRARERLADAPSNLLFVVFIPLFFQDIKESHETQGFAFILWINLICNGTLTILRVARLACFKIDHMSNVYEMKLLQIVQKVLEFWLLFTFELLHCFSQVPVSCVLLFCLYWPLSTMRSSSHWHGANGL